MRINSLKDLKKIKELSNFEFLETQELLINSKEGISIENWSELKLFSVNIEVPTKKDIEIHSINKVKIKDLPNAIKKLIFTKNELIKLRLLR